MIFKKFALLQLITVNAPSRVVAPMFARIEILPMLPAFSVKALGPSTVFDKVMLEVVMSEPPDAVMGPANEIAPPAVIALEMVDLPAPD